MPDNNIACVTGANRGIGFEFVNQLADAGWTVYAGYRDKSRSRELLDLADQNQNVHAVEFDTVNLDQLSTLHDQIAESHGALHLLINNAAVNLDPKSALNEVDDDAIRDSFEINVAGVHFTSRALYPLLAKADGAKVVNIGSELGSVEVSNGNTVPYRLSKCALNMLTSVQAEAYKDDKVISVVVSPGWVRTDMGGQNADLSTEESVRALLKLIDGLSLDDSGKFLKRDGKPIPY